MDFFNNTKKLLGAALLAVIFIGACYGMWGRGRGWGRGYGWGKGPRHEMREIWREQRKKEMVQTVLQELAKTLKSLEVQISKNSQRITALEQKK